ncbi:MAG: xanthine dehydrogenase molybdopterin binding subunit [Magnetospirillum sp.]|nr:xanthine dehydrogenase molybdopterin binding subunit [Magnetospirillum sp.]
MADRPAPAIADPTFEPVGKSARHDSALLHVTGEATYIDDIAAPADTLETYCLLSPKAHAKIKSIDLSAVRAAPGVRAAICWTDIPGRNDVGPIFADEPILAAGTVEYIGQPVVAIAADTVKQARAAAARAEIVYEDLPAILTIEAAMAAQSFVAKPAQMARGDVDAALAASPNVVSGEFANGAQDHFYLEGHIALAVPLEDGQMRVHSSTQHPTEVQKMVAGCLNLSANQVTVEMRRMGGGFGGKETQPAIFACIAALLARRTGRAVKYRVDRDDDFMISGKRHDFRVRYKVGFDGEGRLLALDIEYAARAGHVADLSTSIVDRALFHTTNVYYVPAVRARGYACKTNTQSNTAFRGFGGPQGLLAAEHVIDRVARHLGLDPLDVRKRNFFGPAPRDLTHYGQTVEDFVADRLVNELAADVDYAARRRAIDAFNAANPVLKKGMALCATAFGISFTATWFNQAGALVHVYTDGSIALNHGGTEMGQGLHVKIAQIVAHEFGVALERVRIQATDTGKVPNTSATAASAGSDLNGQAARRAAAEIKQRLAQFVAGLWGVSEETVVFAAGEVRAGTHTLKFEDAVAKAYMARVPLSATGFYATPKIHWDRARMWGRPFYYYAYGAAYCEATIDTLTGEYRIDRAEILHDAGRSLNPAIDLGQVEGGFVQGMGWVTSEEIWFDGDGRLRTHAPSTYKIPVARDLPPVFRARLWRHGENREDNIHRSKAVGEPPLTLAVAPFLALQDAVAAAVPGPAPVLTAPATPERVLMTIEKARAQ